MRKYIKWTPEMVAEISERYKKETAVEIAKDLGIKTLTLRAHMHKHGIKNTKKLMGWSKESLDLIKSEYATCERPQALAIRIGIPLPKMQRMASYLGIRRAFRCSSNHWVDDYKY